MKDIADWKIAFAQAIATECQTPQAATCEQELLAGIQEDGVKLGMQFVEDLLVRGKAYIACKFGGSDTPQAQAAWDSLFATVTSCAFAHVTKLLRKDYTGFITGVLTCVSSKLIGEFGDTGGTDANGSQYAPSTRNRCGGR